MSGIPEEDEVNDDEAEKMVTEKPREIPKTGGLVEPIEKVPWSQVIGRASKLLLPFRRSPADTKEFPVEQVGCCSFIWLQWMTHYMIRANKHGLYARDLFNLPNIDTSAYRAGRLQRLWNEEERLAEEENRRPSLIRCVLKFVRIRFSVAAIFLMISVVLQFLAPSLLLKMILDFVNDPTLDVWWGWTLVLLLTVLLIFRAIFFNANFSISILTAVRTLGAAQYLGYSKLLRLASPSDANFGQFITFCTGDNERIFEAIVGGLLLFGTPVMFLMAIVFILKLVGPIGLIGCAVILLFYPLMGGLAALTSVLRLKVVAVTDKRVTLMNELVGAIRLIKMYAWEDPFRQRVREIRRHEKNELQKAAFLQSISTSITPSITIIATIVTIMALTMTGFPLTAPIAFTLFSIFTALQFTVGTLPYALKCITEAKVGFNRLQKLLQLPEHESPLLSRDNDDDDNFAINISDANFAWELQPEDKQKIGKAKKDKKAPKKTSDKKLENGSAPVESEPLNKEQTHTQVLNNINLKVPNGQLLGVAGHVGAGKSSLVSAIMGEMKRLSGDMKAKGSLAVVPQQAWIFNGTVRDNILFGAGYIKDQYERVIDACALKTDFELLKEGDQTWIGEKGVNLSGGQKQRISLARALYAASESSIFLLDDPLSAVDPKVAKEIFDKYVIKFLKVQKKTVIFVSHGIQFLRQCDKIAFVKSGTIAEYGPYTQLMESKADFQSLVSFETEQKPEMKKDAAGGLAEETNSTVRITRVQSIAPTEENVLQTIMAQDETEAYEVGWTVVLKYFKACGGYFVVFLLFMGMFVFALARLFTAIWLQIWLDDGDGLEAEREINETMGFANYTDVEKKGFITDNPRLWFYQLIYGISLIILIVVGIIKAVALAIRLLAASSKLHDSMLKRVLYAPMSFFDTTSSGKILNRFSKDMDELDVRIPFYFEFVTTSIFFCLTQIAMACYVYPLFTIAFIVIAVVFLTLDMYMNRGVGMTKRIDNETKSAVLHDISSMVPGIPTIRAFERQHVFQKKFNESLNRNLSAQAMFRYSNRWFSIRMDLLGTATIVTTAAVAVASRGSVSPAEAGLALANVFQVATFIPFVMQLKAEFRARFNSVERVCQYAIDLPQEAAAHVSENVPPSNWPQSGHVEFKEVCLRYREDLPLVLRGVTFEVRPGQKVGIVGRTGAGKTSLLGALLRLTELDSGSILIDNVDISKIGLFDLRSAVAVIPQDPVLFEGTLRYNLDPFGRYDDAALWSALEKSHLKEKISSTDHEEKGSGLDLKVESDGDNFSVGEKQLICLARALLRGNKILLLDEATASVDLKTDYLIQTTIREAFSDCTVLTIAHRVHTILNYDKVIVLRRGKLIEEGSPSELERVRDGVFASMLAASQSHESHH